MLVLNCYPYQPLHKTLQIVIVNAATITGEYTTDSESKQLHDNKIKQSNVDHSPIVLYLNESNLALEFNNSVLVYEIFTYTHDKLINV